jgi:sugar phosphate isomerase/epimerase
MLTAMSVSSGSLDVSRRTLLAAAAGVAAQSSLRAATPAAPLTVSIFSKHLRFLEGEALAKTAAELGFGGVDLTVRKHGHVEPARASKELPGLVGIIRQHGLEVPMITTDIVDTNSPFAEDILRTMNSLGIRYYRWGGFEYDYARPMAPQLDALKPRIAALADLNKRYNVTAIYHTHSGVGLVGASIWDLYILLKDFDPNAVAVNYDVSHATIEGGLGGWIDSFQILGPYLRGIAVKDFVWAKGASGNWQADFVPLGTGMVHFRQFFGMVKQKGFSGPLQMHFEYPLGGAENGDSKLTVSQEVVFSALKRDLKQLRSYLKESGLAT